LANGFWGTREEWDRIDRLLGESDALLAAFARQHGFKLESSERWPRRALSRDTDLDRLIEFWPIDQESTKFRLGVTACEDRRDGRYWRQRTLLDNVSWEEMKAKLPALLEEARELVCSWTAADLVPAHPKDKEETE
jgi:hypothetical protein